MTPTVTIAPWIVDSWREAIAALVLDLPVLVHDPYAALAILAAAALASAPIAWAHVAALPARARHTARALAVATLSLPAALFVAEHVATRAALDEHPAAPVVAGPLAPPPALAPVPALGEAPPRPLAAGPAAPDGNVPERGVTVVAAGPPAPPVIPPVAAPPRVIEPTAPPPALVDAPQPVATARTPAPPRGGAVVTVLLATDRVRDGDRYGTARHDDLGLAVAEVRMPVDGSDGRIEIVRLTAASQPEAIAAARDKLALSERYPDHALVVVHGYATAVETAVVRAAQLAHDLAFDGAVVVYSWASAAAPARYADDVAAARATTAQLARALALVGGETGARTTSVIAIGLGARPVLDAVAALPARAGVDGHVLLLAPDVAVPALTAVATTRTDVARRITVYASARDRGLEVTRRHAGATPRAGDVTDAGPPLIPAVRTVDLTAVPVDPLSTAVPVAVDQRALVAHLAAVLASPPPPNPQPTAPTAGLDRITTPAGVYWRHPEAGAGR